MNTNAKKDKHQENEVFHNVVLITANGWRVPERPTIHELNYFKILLAGGYTLLATVNHLVLISLIPSRIALALHLKK